MPGSIYILGIDNHLALALYTDSCMHGPGPFMFWHKWSGGGTIYDNISGPTRPIMSNINGPPGPFMW